MRVRHVAVIGLFGSGLSHVSFGKGTDLSDQVLGVGELKRADSMPRDVGGDGPPERSSSQSQRPPATQMEPQGFMPAATSAAGAVLSNQISGSSPIANPSTTTAPDFAFTSTGISFPLPSPAQDPTSSSVPGPNSTPVATENTSPSFGPPMSGPTSAPSNTLRPGSLNSSWTLTSVIRSTDSSSSEQPTVAPEPAGSSSTGGVSADQAASAQVSNGMSDGTKIGLGVGLGLGIPLVILAAAGAFILSRRRRNNQDVYESKGWYQEDHQYQSDSAHSRYGASPYRTAEPRPAPRGPAPSAATTARPSNRVSRQALPTVAVGGGAMGAAAGAMVEEGPSPPVSPVSAMSRMSSVSSLGRGKSNASRVSRTTSIG